MKSTTADVASSLHVVMVLIDTSIKCSKHKSMISFVSFCLLDHRGVAGHSQVLTNSRDTCGSTLVKGRLCAIMMAAVNPSPGQVI